jgi:hypothetical protein
MLVFPVSFYKYKQAINELKHFNPCASGTIYIDEVHR